MKSNTILKRMCAYIVDVLLVTLVSSALTYISFINPKYEEYNRVSEEYTNVLNDYYEGNIKAEELSDQVSDLSYELSKSGYVCVIADIAIAFLYFGVFAYATNGQTLGKKIMGIKVVSAKEGKKLKLYNYFIRLTILNGVIANVCSLIAICFKESTFTQIYNVGTNIDSVLLIVNLLMIGFQKEGRGLHDILAGTKVIDLKAPVEQPVEEPQEEISTEPKEEEEVIKPQKTTKKATSETKAKSAKTTKKTPTKTKKSKTNEQ